MTEEFEIIHNFIGFGNPDGTYWFIGLEEADEWGKDSEEDRKNLEEYRKRIISSKPGDMQEKEDDYKRKNSGKRFTRVYDIMSQLVLAASTETESDPLEYRNNKLLIASGETFQANLYPLGKKSLEAWPAPYVELFGFKSKEDYYREVTGERFRMLREAWTKYHPRVTICFGRTEWVSFKKLLKLESETDYQDCGWYQVYPSRIILCPFFVDHKMSNENIKLLGQEIRRLSDKTNPR